MQCPRCDMDNVEVMVKSPVGDVWEMYICETCYFSWRSTEQIEVDPLFRLDPTKLDELGVIPPVPPLDPGVKA
ncbi:non-oxidative hydroxyarylic acid decarboxylases subunit D [uncultured Tessaracoccus sp.]|uniref:non-oxidative hydroxyarylic acid decarboxylases subunit D n=1 Tax=uncultured Tessaracoccus sp. TaxID=905023 RepID=UPI0025DBA2DE|nr:non-oxidative hydroxyarylic acid decarboxylases subunit D [uncultured Tessaracoccus sp.]